MALVKESNHKMMVEELKLLVRVWKERQNKHLEQADVYHSQGNPELALREYHKACAVGGCKWDLVKLLERWGEGEGEA